MFSIQGNGLFTFFLISGILFMLLAAITILNTIEYRWITYFAIAYLSITIIVFILSNNISIKEITLLGSAQIWLGFTLLCYFYLGRITEHAGFNSLLLILLIIIIWVNDIFAYLTGNVIGKHPLSKNISPGKTIEGFLGGILFSVLTGYIIAQYIENANEIKWMAISVVIAITSTLGDLFESKIKRETAVKDSGNVFPGHGGMLDRFDSLLFSAPAFLLLYLIL